MTRRRVNFVRLITDLRGEGLSQADIAARCDCTQAAISAIARDPRRQPGYAIGAALVALHGEVVSRPRGDVLTHPRTSANDREHPDNNPG